MIISFRAACGFRATDHPHFGHARKKFVINWQEPCGMKKGGGVCAHHEVTPSLRSPRCVVLLAVGSGRAGSSITVEHNGVAPCRALVPPFRRDQPGMPLREKGALKMIGQ